MFSDARRRLVGLLAAIALPTALGAIALPAHALSPTDPLLTSTCTSVPGNLVANCGFEAGPEGPTAPGWTHLVTIASGVENNGSPAAHAGANDLVFPSEVGDDVWTQTIPVSPHAQYLVGAWVQVTGGASNSAQDDLTISATNVSDNPNGTTLYSTRNTLLIGWHLTSQIITTGSGHSLTLAISGSNAPGDTFVDDVFVAPQRSGCAAIANNLVANCGFEASPTAPTSWTASGVTHSSGIAPSQDTPGAAEGGTQSLYFASGADDAWFQLLNVRPHTQYTLSYWTEYYSGGAAPRNDLTVSLSDVASVTGGTLAIANSNMADHVWESVTKRFTTGSGSTAIVTITGANDPGFTYVDDVGVTAVPHVKVAAKRRALTTTITGLGGQRVVLQHLVRKHWRSYHTWIAPKTGWSKSWTLHVPAGRWRATAASAPGYSATISPAITVH